MRLLLVLALAMVALACDKTIHEVRQGPPQTLTVAMADQK